MPIAYDNVKPSGGGVVGREGGGGKVVYILGLCTGMEKTGWTGFSIRFENRFFGIRKTGIRLVSNQILNSYDTTYVYDRNVFAVHQTRRHATISSKSNKHMSLLCSIQFPP